MLSIRNSKYKLFHKLIISLLLLSIVSTSYCQEAVPTISDYQKFYKTKTLIVLEDSPLASFNFTIKDIVKKDWKLTDYDFITYDEFDQKKSDPKYSFLITSIVSFNKDKTKAKYNFLSLVLGGSGSDITNMKDLCSVPMSYLRVDEDKYMYKLPSLVRFIQGHVELVSSNPSIITENVLRYYNKNTSEIKNKTLYILQSELASKANSLSKIRKVYSGKVKIVDIEEIKQAIKNKREDIVYLHKVGPETSAHKARCFKLVIGASDAKIYYFDFHMIKNKQTDSFLISDFRKLVN